MTLLRNYERKNQNKALGANRNNLEIFIIKTSKAAGTKFSTLTTVNSMSINKFLHGYTVVITEHNYATSQVEGS